VTKRNLFYLLIAFSLIVISCRSIPKVVLTERDLKLTMKHDGYIRNFILHIPEHHEHLNKIPLIIALHGGGGDAEGMIRLTKGRFNELADLYGLLIVYPQGLGKSWHDGRKDTISYAHENNIDDVGFLSKIIQTMIQKYKADPERIFVTGISNGAFMSIRVSRELVDQVKAVAPVCAAIPVETKEAHLAAAAMNIMIINGTADPLVPYNGGDVQILGKKRGKVLSTDETVAIFNKRNNCSDVPKIENLEDRDPQDGTRITRYEYSNADNTHKTILLSVVNGGHTWPGGWPYLGEWLIGRTSNDINACDAIWAFFSSLQ
jgi:polyhydroxybutyrate depolymerase